jgi:hypothetical protein
VEVGIDLAGRQSGEAGVAAVLEGKEELIRRLRLMIHMCLCL